MRSLDDQLLLVVVVTLALKSRQFFFANNYFRHPFHSHMLCIVHNCLLGNVYGITDRPDFQHNSFECFEFALIYQPVINICLLYKVQKKYISLLIINILEMTRSSQLLISVTKEAITHCKYQLCREEMLPAISSYRGPTIPIGVFRAFFLNRLLLVQFAYYLIILFQ